MASVWLVTWFYDSMRVAPSLVTSLQVHGRYILVLEATQKCIRLQQSPTKEDIVVA